MSQNPTASILEHFAKVEGPRVEYLVHYQFIDIVTIALCAIIAGVDKKMGYRWPLMISNFFLSF